MTDGYRERLADGDAAEALARAQTASERAVALERLGRLDAVEAEVGEAPDEALAWLACGMARLRRGEPGGAAEAFDRAGAAAHGWLAAEHLAASTRGTHLDGPHLREVAELFERYAPSFDEHLVGALAYRGHELLPAAVARAAGAEAGRWRVLDLGCGTGLCGPGLRGLARRLIGVDLAAAMLEVARGRGCYDALFACDLVYALATWPTGGLDCVVAADALGYVGPLEAFFEETARALAPGGWLAFTVEASGGRDRELGAARRVLFGEDYLRTLAERHQLDVVELAPTSLRREAATPAAAHLAVLRRRPPEDSYDSSGGVLQRQPWRS